MEGITGISPADIDSVRVGQIANVRLSAYKQRKVPIIDGHVTYVAADQVTDLLADCDFGREPWRFDVTPWRRTMHQRFGPA